VIVNGEEMTGDLLESVAGQELSLLTTSPSYDHILLVLRRLRRLPWAVRRIVISSSPEDGEDSGSH
jgi:hypothetical protein